MKKMRQKLLLILLPVLFLFFLESCTMIKMGSLFLSGKMEQKNYKKEIECEYQRGLIFVKVRINNTPKIYKFIFDTGAAFNVISKDIALELNLQKKVSDKISDANLKTKKVEFVKIKDIEFAGLHFLNSAAAVMDLQGTTLKCYAADGVIGTNIIRHVPYWQINYKKGKMIITDKPGLISDKNKFFIIPFKRNIQRIPIIEIIADNGIKLKFVVDLGSTGGFRGNFNQFQKICKSIIDFRYYERYGEISGGALGIKKGVEYTGKLNNFKIGDLSINSELIDFIDNVDSSVGNKFFENFIFTLDWKNKKILLFPITDPMITEEKGSFGFSVSYREDKKYLYISAICKNSPAYNAKLKVGDIIVGLNKKSMRHLEFSEYCYWLFQKANELFEKENYIYLEIERKNKILNIGLHKKDWLKNSIMVQEN